MPNYKLTYFDFAGGRGEDCRLALHLAGADFEDDRVKGPTWRERKASTPFGALPVLAIEGKGELAQSNAILAYVGRQFEMHPSDPVEAARHEAIMAAVEDLRHKVQNTSQAVDDEEKKKKRTELADGAMQAWGANIERQIEGPFVAGSSVNVADLKLFVLMKWFVTGGVDHIPKDVFGKFPKLSGLYDAVKTQPQVASWYEKWGPV